LKDILPYNKKVSFIEI